MTSRTPLFLYTVRPFGTARPDTHLTITVARVDDLPVLPPPPPEGHSAAEVFRRMGLGPYRIEGTGLPLDAVAAELRAVLAAMRAADEEPPHVWPPAREQPPAAPGNALSREPKGDRP